MSVMALAMLLSLLWAEQVHTRCCMGDPKHDRARMDTGVRVVRFSSSRGKAPV